MNQNLGLELKAHEQSLKEVEIRDLFAEDPERFKHFSLQACDLLLDYSKQRITEQTIKKLIDLAEAAHLQTKIENLFSGAIVNYSENRPALHTALRDFSAQPLIVEGQDIKPKIKEVIQQMSEFVEALQSGQYRGATGLPFTDILCLGIGGSELGPALVCEALAAYKTNALKLHFVSNVFGGTLGTQLQNLNPETTLCIISSKTFTTPETMENAKSVKAWFQLTFPEPARLSTHLVAVTAHQALALDFGIQTENVFEFWDWVGGRYSIWSAVGLPVVLSIGMPNFMSFLRGARAMDTHFYTAPFRQNMPILMGLIGIWNINFLDTKSTAILPYDDRLKLLPAYLQQLEMESNGKGLSETGQPLSYSTAPVIWGGLGCNGQHAFMQLLHQGTQVIPVDFLMAAKGDDQYPDQHKLLAASCFSQSKALMEGQTQQEVKNDPQIKAKYCPGNRPSNTLLFSDLTPYTLGTLIALYEHKVFVQGVLWGINSFDQWGVELGKTLARKILPDLDKNIEEIQSDSSTLGLIHFVQAKNSQ